MADKIVQQVTPVFDEKSVKDFSKKMEKVSIGTKFTNKLKEMQDSKWGKRAGLGVAGLTMLGAALKGVSEQVSNTNESMNELLITTSRIGEIAKDVNSNTGDVAMLTAVARSYGVEEDEVGAWIRSVQEGMVEGKTKNFGSMNAVEIIKLLPKLWQKGTLTERIAIEKLLGTGDKKSSKFLQGDYEAKQQELLSYETKDLLGNIKTNYYSIEQLGDAVDQLTKMKTLQDTYSQETLNADIINKAKLITPDVIKSQALYQRQLNENMNTLITQSGLNYDMEARRLQGMDTFWTSMAALANPIFQSVAYIRKKVDEGKGFGKILEEIIADGVKAGLKQLFGSDSKNTSKADVNKVIDTINPAGYLYNKLKGIK